MNSILRLPLFTFAALVLSAVQSAASQESARPVAAETSPPFDPAQPAAQMRAVVKTYRPPPQPHFAVRDFGAIGDGQTVDTLAVQKAIDACASTGGSVIVSAGRYVIAPVQLKARMTLYLEEDAVLLGSLLPVDYPVLIPPDTASTANQRSLLYAYKADDLSIDGPGEIDGRGEQLAMSGKEPLRPSLLRIFGSNRVTVRNITLRNPRMWTAVYSECQNLLIEATTTDAPAYCPNLDGMDICDCQDVIIRDNLVHSEDDAICLKSHGADGLKNILVENNTLLCHRANAIKLGTATVGPVEHIRILNNTVLGARFGGICLESVDGSQVHDILVRGLDLYHVGQPLYLRLDARQSGPPEKGANAGKKVARRAPGSMGDITLERIRVLGTHGATQTSVSSIAGLAASRITGVTLRDIAIQVPGGMSTVPPEPGEKSGDYPQSNQFGQTPGSVFFIRHADQVLLERVRYFTAKADARPWLAAVDAEVRTVDCREERLVAPPPSQKAGAKRGKE